MKHSPAFQFYPDDWLGSTQVMLMSPARGCWPHVCKSQARRREKGGWVMTCVNCRADKPMVETVPGNPKLGWCAACWPKIEKAQQAALAAKGATK